MNPKISIITITYNSEKTLEETIRSVVSQEYDNLEYIIIDGGSKDHTLDIVNKYQDKIAYVVSEPDKGISDAFNKGIKAATGEIIGILNSDDVMLPDTLHAIAENYYRTIDIYSLNVIIWDEKNNIKVQEIPDLKFSISKVGHHIAHQGRFISKSAYEKYGMYDVRLKYMMDFDLLKRMYDQKAVFKYIDHNASLYRMGGATSDDESKKLNDRRLVVLNNGGSIYRYYYLVSYHAIRNALKGFVIKVFGQEVRYFLRYKRYKEK